MEILGIDVSYYQGNIDWMTVKNSGVKFAILRLGYTGYGIGKNKALDPMFETYYRNAKAVGIPVGVYYFSRAVTVEEGISEAEFVLKHLQGKVLEYPVYIDVEDNYYQANTEKGILTEAVKAFCNTIEDREYYVGIYANLYWLNNKLDLNELTLYDKWVAQWGSINTFQGAYGMWQFSNSGNIGGINPVDLDYAYKDYPIIMKEYGLNGYQKNTSDGSDENPNKPDTDPIPNPDDDENTSTICRFIKNIINAVKNGVKWLIEKIFSLK